MRHLLEALVDTRRRLHELVLDLDDWMGPRLAIVNPILWEIGHVAWFQEHWMLRHARGHAPLRADGDALYDSARVAHDTRWDLPLPDRPATLAYMAEVLDRALAATGADPAGQHAYFAELAIYHEDMHGEALAYTRRTLDLGPPPVSVVAPDPAGPWPGDVAVPGGTYSLGARPDAPGFVFDNEKWEHEVKVAPFAIARAPVTNSEFAAFVADGGYTRDALWSSPAERPPPPACAALPPHHPVMHVSWFEADAYCRWASRRLPTEAEWELAASTYDKRMFPWGSTPPAPAHANLDARAGGPVDVAAHAAGDSYYGCRQMIGNTWEWTASQFLPYPGFVVDPYAEYSAPWFPSPHMVLRGGCWATRARLLRNTWRNFYPPHRRDVFAGFRTCAP